MKVASRPEFRAAGSLGPRSLDVLQFNAPTGHYLDRNGVEPIAVRPEVAPSEPGAGGHGNRMALSPSDGLQRMSEPWPAATLYFHERNESVLFHHEVDLLAEEANVAVEDSPTPLFQEAFGQRFETASATYGVQE